MMLEQTIARLGLWRLQLLVTNYRCVINKEHWEKRPHDDGSTFSLVLQTILEASIMDVWKMLFGFPDYFWIWLMLLLLDKRKRASKSYIFLKATIWIYVPLIDENSETNLRRQRDGDRLMKSSSDLWPSSSSSTWWRDEQWPMNIDISYGSRVELLLYGRSDFYH